MKKEDSKKKKLDFLKDYNCTLKMYADFYAVRRFYAKWKTKNVYFLIISFSS